ncbi:MAG: extracellular solute-binding protein [Chloroflexota bacterium]|nr:extracellular solute-binding protein [Chloroflexota bacterium]MDQ5868072.1 extracellular solute-binding protein [Chloroflexota bacterium]
MQRLKSRLAPLTVFTLVFTLLLAACGPTGQQGSTPTSVPTAVTEQPTATTAMEEPTATTGAEGPTATAAGTSGETSSDSGTLTVLDWAGYDAPDFWTDFQTSHPNVTVNFEIGASDADIYSKMKAGNQSDVFHPYTGWLQFFVDDGLVEEIDTSKLTNWDKVPDSFKEIGQIDGKQYFVPWDWGFTSILYRTDKIPEGVDSWSALLDPKYKGHISMWDEGPGAVAVSSYIHGWDQTKLTDEQLAQAKAEWTAQRDLNLFYWTGEPELVDAMAKGDVWLAYAWQGAYAQLLSQGVPVAYADPKEGRNSWVGVYGIRKGTENLDLAHKFLDAKLAEATGNNVVNLFYYGHVNEDVMQGITDETLKKTFSLDDPDVLEKTNFTPNLTAEQRDAWTAMWAEMKAAP